MRPNTLRETFDYRVHLRGRHDPVALRWAEYDLVQVQAVEVLTKHGAIVAVQIPDGWFPVFRMRRLMSRDGSKDARLAFVALYSLRTGEVGKVCWIAENGRKRWSHGFDQKPPWHPPELYPNELAAGATV